MAVRDVRGVQGGARKQRDSSCDDDGWDEDRERDSRNVGRHDTSKRRAAKQPSRNGFRIGDCSRIGYGNDEVHKQKSTITHAVRSDGLGFRNLSAVSVGTWWRAV